MDDNDKTSQVRSIYKDNWIDKNQRHPIPLAVLKTTQKDTIVFAKDTEITEHPWETLVNGRKPLERRSEIYATLGDDGRYIKKSIKTRLHPELLLGFLEKKLKGKCQVLRRALKATGRVTEAREHKDKVVDSQDHTLKTFKTQWTLKIKNGLKKGTPPPKNQMDTRAKLPSSLSAVEVLMKPSILAEGLAKMQSFSHTRHQRLGTMRGFVRTLQGHATGDKDRSGVDTIGRKRQQK
uniref:DUF3362 domain-containing protein n=1 Tax=Steinernema glaseri TaxID=37863 RepID=A0A1I7ZAT7_9BILA